MGIKKLWAIPGIGLKVINDVEHVFATINSQDPLLEVKQFCGDEIMQKMVICYAHFYVRMLEIARNFRQYSLLR